MLLDQFRYQMQLFGGNKQDVWGLAGFVYQKPGFADGSSVTVSVPAKLDRERRQLTTISGSLYELGVCEANEEETFKQIEKDAKAGHYERY